MLLLCLLLQSAEKTRVNGLDTRRDTSRLKRSDPAMIIVLLPLDRLPG